MFRPFTTHTAGSFFNKPRLSLSVGTSSRSYYNATQRRIFNPNSAPCRCSHTEISPRRHSYFKGCLTGAFLTTTSYMMFNYFHTPTSLISKGEYCLEARTTLSEVWKIRLRERRESTATHHRLHKSCWSGEKLCNLCLAKQQESVNRRRLKEWVWRITEGGLSEDAPAWVVNRTLQITYNSWEKERILGTWWAECEPKRCLVSKKFR
jgi:hypothetical protein